MTSLAATAPTATTGALPATGLSTLPPPNWALPARTAGDADPLTGLPRAAGFLAELALRAEEARDADQPLSILLVEIDDLEALVRQHGPACGDDLVRHVAEIVMAAVRTGDHVARLADDSFGMLLTRTAPTAARHIAGRLRAAAESLAGPVAWAGLFAPTVTIGLACFPDDATTPAELLRRAATALAEARRIGRNRVWVYTRRPRVPLAVPIVLDDFARSVVVTGRDVSNSGLLVESPEDLGLGTRVALSFQLPGQDAPVNVIGRVVRREPRPGGSGGLWHLGIEFERYQDQDLWRVQAFLHAERTGRA